MLRIIYNLFFNHEDAEIYSDDEDSGSDNSIKSPKIDDFNFDDNFIEPIVDILSLYATKTRTAGKMIHWRLLNLNESSLKLQDNVTILITKNGWYHIMLNLVVENLYIGPPSRNPTFSVVIQKNYKGILFNIAPISSNVVSIHLSDTIYFEQDDIITVSLGEANMYKNYVHENKLTIQRVIM